MYINIITAWKKTFTIPTLTITSVIASVPFVLHGVPQISMHFRSDAASSTYEIIDFNYNC